MAESKSESKAVKFEKDNGEALVASWVSHSAELAERVTTTCFGAARDLRTEVHQRVVATMNFLAESQQSFWKLARTIDERFDKLAGDALEAGESATLNVIRTLRETSHGVQQLTGSISGQLTRGNREVRAVS